jgi:beta-lactamase regulating signal transducer with metallopeptidase domain
MNELGIAVAWSALQVTAFALVAAGIHLAVARRGPGVASFVTVASLGIMLGLTGMVFVPLPPWCRWELRAVSAPPKPKLPSSLSTPSQDDESISDGPEPDLVGGSDQAADGLAWPIDSLRQAWERLMQAQVSSPEPRLTWPMVVAAVFLTGISLGLVRLLLGFWAVHACRRRCRPIRDAALVELTEMLRAEMGCPGPVEVHECPDLATAATVGWRRPVVLLASDWRSWTDTERRAVLAHELAHIQHGDYLAGLLARISVALHFYHPLVYWLAARLHLQQELAADALGARWAGGRTSYLVALASLALRQEDRSPRWPARTFLPVRGTLMRRIQMLRASSQTQGKPLSWRGRALTLGLLGAVAVGVVTLRGPTPGVRAETPAGEENVPASSAPQRYFAGGFHSVRGFGAGFGLKVVVDEERKPFDLSWLPTDALGVLAFRPAAVLGRPDMKPIADALNKELTRELQSLGMKTVVGLPLEEIDLVLGKFMVQRLQAETPDGKKNALVAGLFMIRAVKDFDWKKQLQELAPELLEIKYHDQVYFKPVQGPVPHMFPTILPVLGKNMCYFFPDACTVVVDTEPNLRRLIKRGPVAMPECVWADGWKKVEHGLLAVALDNRGNRLIGDAVKPEDHHSPEVGVILNVEQMVWGIDGPEDFLMQGFATCATEQIAEATFKQVNGILGMTRLNFWMGPALKKPSTDAEVQGMQFATDVLKHAKVQRQGNEVSFRTDAKINSKDFLEVLIKEMK